MDAGSEIKRRQRSIWASGDFPRVSRETVAPLGFTLVEECGIRRGDRVLDVAAGAGNVAIPAALTGADVTASDLTPELFEAGRADAAARGAQLEWVEADVEELPFETDRFDVVTSSMGVMFAPDQQRAAAEIARVCRPKGRIGLINGRPGGRLAAMFSILADYSPPPQPGSAPPLRWGEPDHVRELFGDAVHWSRLEPRTLAIEMFESPSHLRDYYRDNFGPAIAVYERVQGDPERLARLDADLLSLGESMRSGDRLVFPFEYLLAIGQVRS